VDCLEMRRRKQMGKKYKEEDLKRKKEKEN
jgi:hypothetical protein